MPLLPETEDTAETEEPCQYAGPSPDCTGKANSQLSLRGETEQGNRSSVTSCGGYGESFHEHNF